MRYIEMCVRVEPTSSIALCCRVWHLTVDTLQIILAKNHLVKLEEAVPLTPSAFLHDVWGHEINDTAIIGQHSIIVDNSIQIMLWHFLQMESPSPSASVGLPTRQLLLEVLTKSSVLRSRSYANSLSQQSLSVLLFLSSPAHIQDWVLNRVPPYCTCLCFPFLIWWLISWLTICHYQMINMIKNISDIKHLPSQKTKNNIFRGCGVSLLGK